MNIYDDMKYMVLTNGVTWSNFFANGGGGIKILLIFLTYIVQAKIILGRS